MKLILRKHSGKLIFLYSENKKKTESNMECIFINLIITEYINFDANIFLYIKQQKKLLTYQIKNIV